MMLLIGTGASWIGGFVAALFGWDEADGIPWAMLATQVAFAVIAVVIYLNWRNSKYGDVFTPRRADAGNAAGATRTGGDVTRSRPHEDAPEEPTPGLGGTRQNRDDSTGSLRG